MIGSETRAIASGRTELTTNLTTWNWAAIVSAVVLCVLAFAWVASSNWEEEQ